MRKRINGKSFLCWSLTAAMLATGVGSPVYAADLSDNGAASGTETDMFTDEGTGETGADVGTENTETDPAVETDDAVEAGDAEEADNAEKTGEAGETGETGTEEDGDTEPEILSDDSAEDTDGTTADSEQTPEVAAPSTEFFSDGADEEIVNDGVQTTALSGSGTEADPYLITKEADLPDTIPAGTYYALAGDITLTDKQINEIDGTLDGKGNTITVTQKAPIYKIADGGVVQNLIVNGSYSTSAENDNHGGIADALNGTLQNSASLVNITVPTGQDKAGGLVGEMNRSMIDTAKMTNCYYAGTMSGDGGYSVAVWLLGGAGSNIYYLSTSSSKGAVEKDLGVPEIMSADDAKTETEMKSAEFVNLLNTNIADTGFSWAYNEGGYPVLSSGEAPAPAGDFTKLNELIKYCDDTYFSEWDYTALTYGRYNTAYTAATELVAAGTASQKKIDQTEADLQAAIDGLRALLPYTPYTVPADAVKISSASDLLKVLSGETTEKNYVLTNDITIDAGYSSSAVFDGTLDGQGHKIIFKNGAPLFGSLGENGAVQNVGLTGTMADNPAVGPLGSVMSGAVVNVYSTVKGNVCGLAGQLAGRGGTYAVFNYNSATALFGSVDANAEAIIRATYWTEGMAFDMSAFSNYLDSRECRAYPVETVKDGFTIRDMLNSNRGENGVAWGKNCDGTPYLGADVNDHSWDKGIVKTAVTCKTPGEKIYTCTVCGETRTETIPVLTTHTWDAGKVTKKATCTQNGAKTYTCKVCGTTKTEPIHATGHKYTGWKTTTPATVFAPAKQTNTCSVDGAKLYRNYGSKLKPTVKFSTSTLPLKAKQKFTGFRVSGLARGDSVKSWKSSNTKIVKVSGKSNGKCTLTAQKKTGTAKIYVTLKSGLKKSFKVKVQSSSVKTSKIKGVPKSIKVQSGKKATLKPSRYPISSREKITYSSSNKNVATVNSKGQIRAKRPGAAKITVRAGKKKVTCTVRVSRVKTKSIRNVKTSVTVKRGKTYTLKPKLSPSNSTEKITYKSSNKKIATVSSKGKITAKKKGTVTITVKSGSKSVKCKVKVR